MSLPVVDTATLAKLLSSDTSSTTSIFVATLLTLFLQNFQDL